MELILQCAVHGLALHAEIHDKKVIVWPCEHCFEEMRRPRKREGVGA